MVKIRNSLILAVLVFFYCCEKQEKKSIANGSVEPAFLDSVSVTLPLHYSEGIRKLWHFSQISGVDYLYDGVNQNGSLTINVLNASDYTYLPTIEIPQYGPNGFKGPSPSFLVKSFDSILVFPTSLNRVYLYDSTGIRQNEYNFETDFNLSFDSNEELQGTAFMDGKLFLHAVPYANPNKLDFFEKTFASYELDLTNERIKPHLKYPEFLMGKVLPTSFLGAQLFIAFDSLLITNHYFNNQLIVQNLNSSLSVENIQAGLDGYKHLKGMDKPIDNQSKESISLQIRYPRYTKAFYDPYRKKVYRVVEHLSRQFSKKDTELILEEIVQNNSGVFTTSLIEIDERLKVSRILTVPSSNYYVPTSKGLLIQLQGEGKGMANQFMLLDIDGR